MPLSWLIMMIVALTWGGELIAMLRDVLKRPSKSVRQAEIRETVLVLIREDPEIKAAIARSTSTNQEALEQAALYLLEHPEIEGTVFDRKLQ